MNLGGAAFTHGIRVQRGATYQASVWARRPIAPPALPPARGVMREGRIGRRYSDADTVQTPPVRTVVDRHPLQGTVSVDFPDYRLTTGITLRHDERILRFQTRYIPAGRRYRLGMTFPTAIRNGRIRYSVPCGHIVRPEGEFAPQEWIDYADKQKGLLLLNRGLPGNRVTGHVMMLSLFRALAMTEPENATCPPHSAVFQPLSFISGARRVLLIHTPAESFRICPLLNAPCLL